MNTLKVMKFHEDAMLPTETNIKGRFDLYVHSKYVDWDKGLVTYKLGVGLKIPEGWVGLIVSKPSITKYELRFQGVCIVDPESKDELEVEFRLTNWIPKGSIREEILYDKEDCCCQLILIESHEFEVSEVDSLRD